MTQNQTLTTAREAGATAFHNDQPCAPALDDVYHELIEGLQPGEGIPIAKAWIAGWTSANLRQNDIEPNIKTKIYLSNGDHEIVIACHACFRTLFMLGFQPDNLGETILSCGRCNHQPVDPLTLPAVNSDIDESPFT